MTPMEDLRDTMAESKYDPNVSLDKSELMQDSLIFSKLGQIGHEFRMSEANSPCKIEQTEHGE